MKLPSAFVVIAAVLAISACSDNNNVTSPVPQHATIRIVNASGTAPAFTVSSGGTNLATNVATGTSSTCLSIPAGSTTLNITDTTGATLATVNQSFGRDTAYTILLTGNTGAFNAVVLPDTFSAVGADSGRVRFFNAVSVANGGPFDIIITAPGDTLTTPVVTALSSGSATAFLGEPAGAEEVRFTTSGTKNVVIDVNPLDVTAGQNVTLVAADSTGGTGTPQAILVGGCT